MAMVLIWPPGSPAVFDITTLVAGAEAADNLIEVAIVSVADEAEAKAAVSTARPALLSLVPS